MDISVRIQLTFYGKGGRELYQKKIKNNKPFETWKIGLSFTKMSPFDHIN